MISRTPLLAVLALALTIAVPCSAKDSGIVSAVSLSVNRVGIGTLRSDALARLGKPARTVHRRDTEMGLGDVEEMEFGGLFVEVAKPEPSYVTRPLSETYLWRLVISGPRWKTNSGLRVGSTRTKAIKILGPPRSESREGDITRLHYDTKGFDGFLWLDLRNDRIVELGVSEDWS